jgi:hypothetical protein
MNVYPQPPPLLPQLVYSNRLDFSDPAPIQAYFFYNVVDLSGFYDQILSRLYLYYHPHRNSILGVHVESEINLFARVRV